MTDDDKGSNDKSNKLARVSDDWAMSLEPVGFDATMRLAGIIAAEKWCGITSRGDAYLRIHAGRNLGFSAIQSIQEVYNIKGRPCVSAKALMAKVRTHPDCEYFTLVESTDKLATFKIKRRGDDEVVMSYTWEMAQKMKLAGLDNYQKQPATMLMWRCVTHIARPTFPDALMGFYSREEMGDGHALPAEVIVTPEPPQVAVKAPEPPPSDVQSVDVRDGEYEEADDPANDLPPEPTLEQLEQSFISSIALVTTKAALESVYYNAKYSGIDENAVKRIYRAVSLRLGAINGKKAG